MTFWTLQADPPITLCAQHALESTEAALGGESFDSMEQAAVILSALAAFADVDLGLTSHDVGPCESCGEGSAA